MRIDPCLGLTKNDEMQAPAKAGGAAGVYMPVHEDGEQIFNKAYRVFRKSYDKDASGFTLIEVLVVIFIISISFGFAFMAFGDFGKSRQVTLCADQLQSLIHRIREQAILNVQDYSIEINATGFKTFTFNAQGQPIPHEHSRSTSGKFPESLSITPPLNLRIHASGMISPFQLHLGTQSEPNQLLLTGSANGHLTLKKP